MLRASVNEIGSDNIDNLSCLLKALGPVLLSENANTWGFLYILIPALYNKSMNSVFSNSRFHLWADLQDTNVKINAASPLNTNPSLVKSSSGTDAMVTATPGRNRAVVDSDSDASDTSIESEEEEDEDVGNPPKKKQKTQLRKQS